MTFPTRPYLFTMLLLCLALGASFVLLECVSRDGAAQQALTALNRARVLAGVQPVRAETRLTWAARWQAQYVADTEVAEHYRTRDQGLFGLMAAPAQRRRLAGYFGRASESLSYTSYSAPEAQLQVLLNAPYHRIALLDPGPSRAGAGVLAREHDGQGMQGLAFELADYLPQEEGTLVAWPADGATGVPAAFAPASETPHIAEGVQLVGYVVTLHVGLDRRLTPGVFTLTDGTTGQSVLGQLRFADNDAAMPQNAAAFVPQQPLRPATPYVAHFEGQAQGQAVNKTWTFTTAERITDYRLSLANPTSKPGEPLQFRVRRPSTAAAVCVRASSNWRPRVDWQDPTSFEVRVPACPEQQCALKITLSASGNCAADPNPRATTRLLEEGPVRYVSERTTSG